MRVADLDIGDVAVTITWDGTDEHYTQIEIRQYLGPVDDDKGSLKTYHINGGVMAKPFVLFKTEGVETFSSFGLARHPNVLKPEHKQLSIITVFTESIE